MIGRQSLFEGRDIVWIVVKNRIASVVILRRVSLPLQRLACLNRSEVLRFLGEREVEEREE